MYKPGLEPSSMEEVGTLAVNEEAILTQSLLLVLAT